MMKKLKSKLKIEKIGDFIHSLNEFKLLLIFCLLLLFGYVILLADQRFNGRIYLDNINVEIEDAIVNNLIIETIRECIKNRIISREDFINYIKDKNVNIYFGSDNFYFSPNDVGYIFWEYNNIDVNIYIRNIADENAIRHEIVHLMMRASGLETNEHHKEMERLGLCYGGCPDI